MIESVWLGRAISMESSQYTGGTQFIASVFSVATSATLPYVESVFSVATSATLPYVEIRHFREGRACRVRGFATAS